MNMKIAMKTKLLDTFAYIFEVLENNLITFYCKKCRYRRCHAIPGLKPFCAFYFAFFCF